MASRLSDEQEAAIEKKQTVIVSDWDKLVAAKEKEGR